MILISLGTSRSKETIIGIWSALMWLRRWRLRLFASHDQHGGVGTQKLIATVVVVSGWNTIVGEHPLLGYSMQHIDLRSKKQRISARWHKKRPEQVGYK